MNGKVPSYLGTSASFVAAVTVIRAQGGDSADVTGAILVAGVILALVGDQVHFGGARYVRAVLPPAVTGAVVMLIGFNLARVATSIYFPSDQWIALLKTAFLIAVAVLGLDRFNRINDALGHDLGDEALHLVVLVEEGRENDHLGTRLGDGAQALGAGCGGAGDGEGERVLDGKARVELPERRRHAAPGPLAVLVDGDVDALRDREVGHVALGEEVPHDPRLLREAGRRLRAGADESLPELDGPTERVGMVAAEPDRRVRVLEWLQAHRRPVEAEEAPLEGDRRFAPERLEQRQALVEAADRSLRGDPERRVRPVPSPGHDTDLEPSPAELVDARELPGEVDRAVQRRDEDGAAEPNPLGAGGGEAEGGKRAEDRGGAEKLLLDPGALEAELLGAPDVAAEAGRVGALPRPRRRSRNRRRVKRLRSAGCTTGRVGGDALFLVTQPSSAGCSCRLVSGILRYLPVSGSGSITMSTCRSVRSCAAENSAW